MSLYLQQALGFQTLWLSSASVTPDRTVLLDRKWPIFLGVMAPPSYARGVSSELRTKNLYWLLVSCCDRISDNANVKIARGAHYGSHFKNGGGPSRRVCVVAKSRYGGSWSHCHCRELRELNAGG